LETTSASKKAKTKYAIVLNNDTKVAGNFIEKLVEIAESNEKIGSVGCKIVQSDGSIRYGPKYMGTVLSFTHIKNRHMKNLQSI